MILTRKALKKLCDICLRIKDLDTYKTYIQLIKKLQCNTK